MPSQSRVTRRVLIVEDAAVLRKHLARLFAREGYMVTTAANCAEALAQLNRTHFDVLLLDLALPDGDGLDLLAGLRDRQPLQTLVMTASCTPEKERRAGQLKVSVLRKPLDLVLLIDAVRSGAP